MAVKCAVQLQQISQQCNITVNQSETLSSFFLCILKLGVVLVRPRSRFDLKHSLRDRLARLGV